jgi:hypothetical protein
MRMNRGRARTHMIEHLVDGLADYMQFVTVSRASGAIGSAHRKHINKDMSRGMT